MDWFVCSISKYLLSWHWRQQEDTLGGQSHPLCLSRFHWLSWGMWPWATLLAHLMQYPWLQLWNDDDSKCFLFRFLLQASDVNIQMLTWHLHLDISNSAHIKHPQLKFSSSMHCLSSVTLDLSILHPHIQGDLSKSKSDIAPPPNPPSAFHFPQSNNNDH